MEASYSIAIIVLPSRNSLGTWSVGDHSDPSFNLAFLSILHSGRENREAMD